MDSGTFHATARLGQTAVVTPAWQIPYRGRVVGLTKPRHGAYVRDSATGLVRYTDCVFIRSLLEGGHVVSHRDPGHPLEIPGRSNRYHGRED